MVELSAEGGAVKGCGSPQAPVSRRDDDGRWRCHCAAMLEATTSLPETYFPTSPGPVASCASCGCHVALVGSAWTPETALPALDAAELARRLLERHRIIGYGMEVETHEPCPFCAAPDFRVMRILHTLDDLSKECVCGQCGRSARWEVQKTGSGVEVELVQTGGPPPPPWYTPVPRRSDASEPS